MPRRLRAGLFAVFSAGLLAGCSIFEGSGEVDPIFKNMETGPPNPQLADELPDDLRGDRENARDAGQAEPPPALDPAQSGDSASAGSSSGAGAGDGGQ